MLKQLWARARQVSETHEAPFSRTFHRCDEKGWFRYEEDEDDGVHALHAGLYWGSRLIHDSSSGGGWDWPVLEYMAAACNAVPGLLARIEELEAKLKAHGIR